MFSLKVKKDERVFFIGRLKFGSSQFISERVGGLVKEIDKDHVALTNLVRIIEVRRELSKDQINQQARANVNVLKSQKPDMKPQEENALIAQTIEALSKNAFGVTLENIQESVFTEVVYKPEDFSGYTYSRETENPELFKQFDDNEAKKRMQAAGLSVPPAQQRQVNV